MRTVTTRAQLYVTTAEDRKAEISHVRNALRANNYKEWALDVPPTRSKKQVTTTDKTTTRSKDKTPKEKLCGTIYHITCDDDTLHTYIGETKIPLSVRFKEHCKLDKPTGVGDHCNAKVKEAIHIKQRAPSMNRDQGYQLPPIYGQIIPRPPPPEPNHPP